LDETDISQETKNQLIQVYAHCCIALELFELCLNFYTITLKRMQKNLSDAEMVFMTTQCLKISINYLAPLSNCNLIDHIIEKLLNIQKTGIKKVYNYLDNEKFANVIAGSFLTKQETY